MGADGRGSVTSALEALRREEAAKRSLRAPDSPGARFRAEDRQLKQPDALEGRDLYERRFVTAAGPRSPDADSSRTETVRKQTARKLSAREQGARSDFNLANETSSLVNRRIYNADQAKEIDDAALAIGYGTGAAVSAATRGILGTTGSRIAGTAFGGYSVGPKTSFDGYGTTPYVPKATGGYYGYWDNYGCYYSPYSSWWNWGFGYSSGWGWYVGYNYCSPYWYKNYYSPWWYSSPAYYYPTIVHHYYDSWDNNDDVVVNVYTSGDVGESVAYTDTNAIYDAGYAAGANSNVIADGSYVTSAGAAQPTPPAAEQPAQGLNSAALRYLELGDSAFSSRRYIDAVHFYTRAIEFQADQGMLHLVLSDALFATGDYHAAAGSIRRALTLDPTLVAAPVDKHLFYKEPVDFDQQLAKLELHFKEQPNDADARLVLAMNYLFGGRPLAAVELLEGAPTEVYGEVDMAAQLVLDSARLARWGANPPAEAGWK